MKKRAGIRAQKLGHQAVATARVPTVGTPAVGPLKAGPDSGPRFRSRNEVPETGLDLIGSAHLARAHMRQHPHALNARRLRLEPPSSCFTTRRKTRDKKKQLTHSRNSRLTSMKLLGRVDPEAKGLFKIAHEIWRINSKCVTRHCAE